MLFSFISLAVNYFPFHHSPGNALAMYSTIPSIFTTLSIRAFTCTRVRNIDPEYLLHYTFQSGNIPYKLMLKILRQAVKRIKLPCYKRLQLAARNGIGFECIALCLKLLLAMLFVTRFWCESWNTTRPDRSQNEGELLKDGVSGGNRMRK